MKGCIRRGMGNVSKEASASEGRRMHGARVAIGANNASKQCEQCEQAMRTVRAASAMQAAQTLVTRVAKAWVNGDEFASGQWSVKYLGQERM